MLTSSNGTKGNHSDGATKDGASEQPLILILCTSSTAPGHVLPLCEIAKHLVSRGYDITFVGGVQHRHIIEGSGSTFFPVHESLTIQKGPYRKWGMERQKYAEGLPRMRQDFKTFFIGQIPGQFESTKSALLELRRRGGPHREILVINETMWFGYLPFKFGASVLPEFENTGMPKTLGINVTPLMLDSIDVPAMPLGLLPDPTGSKLVQERDAVMRDILYKYVVNEAYEGFREHMRACGGEAVPDDWMVNLSVTAHDTTLQLCNAALEYPRSDLPSHVRFAGTLPKRCTPPDYVFPDWWESDLVANAALAEDDPARKHVVVVSQGTLSLDYTMLLVPTIKALKGKPNMLLIALLGKQSTQGPPGPGPSGPGGPPPGGPPAPRIPPEVEGGNEDNVRIADFVPYSAIFQYADIMVFNGGYGGFTQCAAGGVPMIAAGMTEEKNEVSTRVEWAGLGVNLRTGRPSPEAIAGAVDKILGNPTKYRARAKEVAAEIASGRTLDVVAEEVAALTKLR